MTKPVKGLILCAGKGSRLEPITYSISKTLIPIGNKPMVQRAVETLVDAGISEIGLVVREGAESIQSLLGDGSKWGVNLTYIYQEQALGTGHAVQTALSFIDHHPVLVYLGDNMIGHGLKGLIAAYELSDYPDAMVVTKEVDHPQDYGVVEQINGRIVNIVEKPAIPKSNLALTGIFLFNSSVVDYFRNIPISMRGEYELTSVFDQILTEQGVISSYALDSWWIDAGNPLRLLEANQLIMDEWMSENKDTMILESSDIVIENCKMEGPVMIGAGSKIRDSYIGPYTTIGRNTTIINSKLKNSIIMENSSIVDIDSCITDSIVGEEVSIEKKVNEVNLIVSNKNKIYI